jgi:hypothetical protein
MEAKVGMLVVETITKVRRAYFVDGRPVKSDLPRVWHATNGGSQGHPFSSDGVSLLAERGHCDREDGCAGGSPDTIRSG